MSAFVAERVKIITEDFASTVEGYLAFDLLFPKFTPDPDVEFVGGITFMGGALRVRLNTWTLHGAHELMRQFCPLELFTKKYEPESEAVVYTKDFTMTYDDKEILVTIIVTCYELPPACKVTYTEETVTRRVAHINCKEENEPATT